jgi:hypothetical protein
MKRNIDESFMWRKEAKYLSFVSFHFGAKRKVGSEIKQK